MAASFESLRYLDPCGRCDAIEEMWPGFSGQLLARFNKAWDSTPQHKRRASSRWEAFHSMGNPGLPTPPFFGWERQVFEECLQSLLCDLRVELWRRGEPSQEALDWAGEIAIPSIQMDVSLELSTRSRPDIPLPSDTVSAINRPSTVHNIEGCDGWVRIGCCEEQLTNKTFSEDRPASFVDAFYGSVAIDNDAEVSDVRVPFVDAERTGIWNFARLDDDEAFPPIRGGLVAAMFFNGPTSRGMILGLHPAIASSLGLSLGAWPGQLCLVDASGATGICLNCWRSKPVDVDTVGTCYRLKGCELLLRPDLFRQLEQKLRRNLKVVVRTSER